MNGSRPARFPVAQAQTVVQGQGRKEDEREPTHVWDQINLDLFVKVGRLSILSPAFAMWVPVMLVASRYPPDSAAVIGSTIYVAFCALWSFLNFSSSVWLNQSWKWGLGGMFAMRKADWGDEIVVITGGSKGLGRVLVETIGLRHVTVCVMDKEPVDWSKDFDDVYHYAVDVSDRAAVLEAAEKIKKEVGDPTILINNAGVVHGRPLLELDEAQVRQTFGVNVMAHFWTLQAFLPGMIEQKKGHVVTVSSVLGEVSAPGLSDYCASKAAVTAMHESLRYELKTQHPDVYPLIRFTLLMPGHMRTNMFSSLLAPAKRTQAFLAPVAEPHTIAKQVIHAIDAVESREICTPAYVNAVWLMRGLPTWARDIVRHLGGIDTAVVSYRPPPAVGDKKTE